jgi:hypothetical protein
VAVERDDPTCRHLAASKPLLAQYDAERVGLAMRRRLHPDSEAAIVGKKLRGRCDRLLGIQPTQERFWVMAVAFTGACRELLEVHFAATPQEGDREAALEHGNRAEQCWRELRAAVRAEGPMATIDVEFLEAARAAAATARDLVDGFYFPTQHKGLQKLLRLRSDEGLADVLSRT